MVIKNKTNVKRIRAFLCQYIYAYFVEENEIIYSDIVFNPKIFRKILPFLEEEFEIETADSDIYGFYSIGSIDDFIRRKIKDKGVKT